METARRNRWGHRDATMILTAYRHGFRPAELVDLRWDQIEFASGALHVRRVKQGTRAPIRFSGTSYGPCGGFSASRSPSHRSCSLRNGARPSRPLASPEWSSARAMRRTLASKHIRTCSGTPAGTHWRTRATTPALCKPTLATGTSSTRCATPSYHRCGSRISGAADSRLASVVWDAQADTCCAHAQPTSIK